MSIAIGSAIAAVMLFVSLVYGLTAVSFETARPNAPSR
jgi:hypothetical protein